MSKWIFIEDFHVFQKGVIIDEENLKTILRLVNEHHKTDPTFGKSIVNIIAELSQYREDRINEILND